MNHKTLMLLMVIPLSFIAGCGSGDSPSGKAVNESLEINVDGRVVMELVNKDANQSIRTANHSLLNLVEQACDLAFFIYQEVQSSSMQSETLTGVQASSMQSETLPGGKSEIIMDKSSQIALKPIDVELLVGQGVNVEMVKDYLQTNNLDDPNAHLKLQSFLQSKYQLEKGSVIRKKISSTDPTSGTVYDEILTVTLSGGFLNCKEITKTSRVSR